jgi:hypothetical protein
VRTKRYAIDPNLKQPYMDQLVLGYDRALPLGMVFSVTGVYRKWKNFVETVAQNPQYTQVTGEIGVTPSNCVGSPGGPTCQYVSTGQTVTMVDWNNAATDTLYVTNPSGLQREYKGAMFTLTRNFRSNWQMTASYTYSKTTGNIDNLGFTGNQEIGGLDSGPSSFLDTPNSKINWNGRLTFDPTNQFKLQGTYAFLGPHIWLSANWTYYTGNTYTQQTSCLLSNDDGDSSTPDCHVFSQEAVTGKVWYYAQARGSDRLPDYNEFNARFEWRPPVGKKGSLGVIVDVFNLFNHTQVTSRVVRDNGDFNDPLTYNIGTNIRLGVRYEF